MIVVTGGAGFIGSALVWRLNQLGQEKILVVDSHSDRESIRNLQGLRFQELMDKQVFLQKISDGALGGSLSAILHLGACSDTTCQDEAFLDENNFCYSVSLAEHALKNNIRFIYASSASTYGNGSQGYADDESKLTNLTPLNFYASSKQKFDLWALEKKVLDSIVGLKYFNVFGPNEYHKGEMRSMVLKGFEQIQETGTIRLFASEHPGIKNGEQKRDFLYVKDAVEMTLFFMDHPDLGGIYNLGSGVANSWNQLAQVLFDAIGKAVNITYIPMPQELKGKYQVHTQAEVGKIRKAGYRESITGIETAVADYVQNYLLPDKTLGWTQPVTNEGDSS